MKLLQSDPLINEFAISIKEPETVSRFLGNFSYKTNQIFRDINFKVFRKLLCNSKLTSITIDIDSSVVNAEGHQEGVVKGYNPKKPGSNCYNIQFAFCDELKAFITGFVRSDKTCAAELIKEIVAHVTCACGTGAGKMDFPKGTEYRQQIKTFRLKYIFLAGKII